MNYFQKVRLLRFVLLPIILAVVVYFINNLLLDGTFYNILSVLIITFCGVVVLYSLSNLLIEHYLRVNPNEGLIVHVKNGVLIFIGFTILLAYNPNFSNYWFYVKHIGLFGLIALVLIYLAIMRYNYLQKQPHISERRKLNSKAIIMASVIVMLLVLSRAQMIYVDRYHVPPLMGCSYYDEYKNLIYESDLFVNSCPDLEEVKRTKTTTGSKLSFSVPLDRYDVEYEYDEQNRVTYFSIRKASSTHRDIIKKEIRNTYKDDEVMSVTNKYYFYGDNDIRETKTIYKSEIVKNEYNYNEAILISECDNEACESNVTPLFNIQLSNGYRNYNPYDDEVDIPINFKRDINRYDGYNKYGEIKEIVTLQTGIIKNDDRQYIGRYLRRINPGNTIVYNMIEEEYYDLKTGYLDSEVFHVLDMRINAVVTKTDDYFLLESDFAKYNYMAVKEHTDYGFVLRHYNLRRDEQGRYKESGGDFGRDPFQLNNYRDAVIEKQDEEILNYVYQRNPLLFDYDYIKYE